MSRPLEHVRVHTGDQVDDAALASRVAVFSRADLTNASLFGADTDGAVFDGAVLDNTRFGKVAR